MSFDMNVTKKGALTSGSRSFGVTVTGGRLHRGQILVDLGPHVLQGLGGAAGDVNLGPGDRLVLVRDGDDIHQELVLETYQWCA